MAGQGNFIPVYKDFLANTQTPVSAYLKLIDKSFSYLLESADQGKRWGRYSFIGYAPHLVALFHTQQTEIRERDQSTVLKDARNPLHVLRDLMKRFKPVQLTELPPFQGGLVGYLNYELTRKWEPASGLGPQDMKMPEAVFVSSRRLIIFDHLTHEMKVVAFAHLTEGEDLAGAYNRALTEIDNIMRELGNPAQALTGPNGLIVSDLLSNFEQRDFEAAVRRAKHHIAAGEAIQVVLSQRFSAKISGDDFSLYRNLRSINPSPYMFYLNFGEVRLIGSSPEVLVRLTDGEIELRPIAGTRPRGETDEADREMEEDLREDIKERAEHIMLVDLGRNDVGKVAVPGSVTVPRLMEVERYSHVMHLVSRVKGMLCTGKDCFDVFMSVFPAGTVTGAPKIRAIKIIDELEPCPRGAYAGAAGYFGFNGNMDFCITIRTMLVVKDRLYIQAGAGIVSDSSPQAEYEETMRKAAHMFKAIERAGHG